MDSVVIFGADPRYASGPLPGREVARTPARFRDRVIAQFRSPQNLEYLRALFARRVPAGPQRAFTLATLHSALLEFSGVGGRALDALASDPIAQRGALRPAVNLWDEVRRLNRVFYEDRLAFLRDQAHLIERRAPRDGPGEDEEPYHMRMFISDSLRPPGLEHLNTPGPLHALREDQPADAAGAAAYPYGGEDAPWGRGNPDRSPEEAAAEYWGDGEVATDTQAGDPEMGGRAYGDVNAWGDSWRKNGGTRFMRYESIPFWQQGGRRGYDYDVEETLGTAARELDAHVRRWDMDRVREPRGQSYRRYGPRTGHAV